MVQIGSLLIIAAYVALFAYTMQHTTYDVWGAMWLRPVLIAISVPLLVRFRRGEPNHRITQILLIALVFKLLAIPRYYMVAVLYETGDSLRYADTVTRLRTAFLESDFSLGALGTDRVLGTQFIEIVTASSTR